MKRLNTEIFKKRSIEKHGSRYDYSQSYYVNRRTAIDIICSKHGIFKQKPDIHMNGGGCPTCAYEENSLKRKMTTEKFIKRADIIHNGFYDYRKTNLENRDEKGRVIITCPVHGDFKQLPNNHLQGQGCRKCHFKKMHNVFSMKTDEFIEKANVIHNGFYDYRKTNLENRDEKGRVIITCPVHGDFKQLPTMHISGQGCRKCSIINNAIKHTRTNDEFICISNKKHNNKYDYTKTHYTKAHEKVIITCPVHGDFEQFANDHLKGSGCPHCNESKLEIECEVFFKENSIKIISQCDKNTFEWLGRQSLDFYLPDYNIAIECQGIQHFEAVEYFGGDEKFSVIQECDERKKRLCEENGVKLLYYSNEKYKTFLGEKVYKKLKTIKKEFLV